MTTSRELGRIETKIEKNRERAADQVTKCKNEADERMNDLEKTQNENMDITLNRFSEIKQTNQ